MNRRKRKHFAFNVRGVRVIGGWAIPINVDPQNKWRDRTEGENEPAPRPQPEMKRKR